jgi:hypothetical protein
VEIDLFPAAANGVSYENPGEDLDKDVFDGPGIILGTYRLDHATLSPPPASGNPVACPASAKCKIKIFQQ